jgi:uncharacterized protein involved in exopolysaccharide biosynthesis/Mrp family chromosome partitioning ATPase
MNWIPQEALPLSFSLREHQEAKAFGTLAALWRWRWLIAGLIAASLICAVPLILLLKRTYTADAVIRLDFGRDLPSLSARQPGGPVLDTIALVESEARLIRSRGMARRVVERLRLDQDPAFAPKEDLKARLVEHARTWLAAHISERAAASLLGPPPEPPDRSWLIDQTSASLLSELSVANDSRSYLITVAFTADEPDRAAMIANAFASEYLQSGIEASFDAAQRTSRWLAAQIQEARSGLADAEEAIAAFRQRSGFVEASAEGASLQQEQLRSVAAQLSAATLARISEETRLRRARDAVAAGQVPSAADLSGSPLIQRLVEAEAGAARELAHLSAAYGARHPSVSRATGNLEEAQLHLQAEVAKAIAGIENDVEAARFAESALQARKEEHERNLIEARTREARLRGLQMEAGLVRDRLKALTDSHEQARALSELKPVPAQIVMKAQPEALPSSPKPAAVLGLLAAGAGGLGIALALLLERRDVGFVSERQLTAETGLRCLGTVPRAARSMCVSDKLLRAEAARSIAAAIGLAGRGAGCKVVVVTSSVPKEGKSSFVKLLAQSSASSGHCVLVIDASPRAASRVKEEGYILEHFLESAASLKPPSERITVVRRASGLVEGQELFDTAAFDDMLQHARRRYDVILIEAPPVLLLPDSWLVGRSADAVLLLVRWHRTPRAAVASALQRLNERSTRVTGTVLARINLKAKWAHAQADAPSIYRKYRPFYLSVR